MSATPDRGLIDAIAARLDIPETALTVLAAREGRVICRVSRPEGDLVAKASDTPGDFDREAAAMRTLLDLGLPVSKVVAVEHGPPALLAATWAEGEPITATTDPAALRQVGKLLRRIHSVPAGPPYSANPSVAWWIQGWCNIVFAWWEDAEGIDRALRAACDAWMDEVRPVLEQRPGCLFLLDGRPEHFLVDGEGAVRMIDVADLQPGDAAMDLAVLELDAPGILPHVLEGYAPSPGEQAAFDTLVPFYVFLRALSAAEWRSRIAGDWEATRAYLSIARTALDRRIAATP